MNKTVLDALLSGINKEIDELDDMINVLSSEQEVGMKNDIDVIINRRISFKDAKGMIIKASLDLDGKNENTMNTNEKRLLYKIVRTIIYFKNIFKKKVK